jgi:hypothetical protein
MHYKNGQPAHIGDKIVVSVDLASEDGDSSRQHPYIGLVIGAYPAAEKYNL